MSHHAVIEGRDLFRSFVDGHRRTEVLRGASLTLHAGQVAALVGRSGSGKSTLLQVLGLLAAPDKGAVLIQGRDTSTLSARERAQLRGTTIGFVFQAANLLPQHSALTNVLLPWRGAHKDGQRRAHDLLETFGVSDRADHRPDQLSGGEQQRVALARALVNQPLAILADEPTGSLDAENERTLLDGLRSFAARGTAVLIITHSDVIASSADRRWSLDEGRSSLDAGMETGR